MDCKRLSKEDGRTKLVTRWEVETGKERQRLKGHYWDVASVVFAPDGKTLLSGASDLFVWDLATGKMKRKLRGHEGLVTELAFSPDGKTLASASQLKLNYDVKLWDWLAGKERRTLE